MCTWIHNKDKRPSWAQLRIVQFWALKLAGLQKDFQAQPVGTLGEKKERKKIKALILWAF